MEEERSQKNQQEFQRILTELRGTQQNIESLQAQAEVLSNSIEETEVTLETIEGTKNAEEGKEILVPIGSDTYIPAEIKNPDKVLSNIGVDLVSERGPEEVMKLLNKQKKDFEESLEKIRNRIEELNEKIEDLRPEAQKLMQKSQESEG